MENKSNGDLIPLTIRVYFGQTEIKVDTIFNNTRLIRQSFQYHAENENKYKEMELKHHQHIPPSFKENSSHLPLPVRKESFLSKISSPFGKKKSKS